MHSSRRLQLEHATLIVCEVIWIGMDSRPCATGVAVSAGVGVEARDVRWCAADMHQIMTHCASALRLHLDSRQAQQAMGDAKSPWFARKIK